MTPRMTRTGPDEAATMAAAIEPLAVASWPARETLGVDGWVLRLTDGFSHRANSVVTSTYAGRDPEASVAAVERAYRARGLRPLFQITPLTQPPALEDLLVARGYACMTQTQVQVARAAEVLARLPSSADVVAGSLDDPGFRQLVVDGSHSAADGDERLGIMRRLPGATRFALLRDGQTALACGVGVEIGGWVAVFAMRSHPAHRGRGHARRVLAAIAAWAEERGVSDLFLQVEAGNGPALSLYARAGFAAVYAYRFYAAPA